MTSITSCLKTESNKKTITVKPVYNGHSQNIENWLMRVKSIAEHSAILSTFIKLPFVIKILVVSNFEWAFYTGFTVNV